MCSKSKVENLKFSKKEFQLADKIVESLGIGGAKSKENTKLFLAILIQLSEFDCNERKNVVDTNSIRLELRKKLEEYIYILENKEISEGIKKSIEGIKDITMVKRYLAKLCKHELLSQMGDGKYEFNKVYFGAFPIEEITKIEFTNKIEEYLSFRKNDNNLRNHSRKCNYVHYYTKVDLFKVDVINLNARFALYKYLKEHIEGPSSDELIEHIDCYNIDYVNESFLVNEKELDDLQKKYKEDNDIKLDLTSVILCRTAPREEFIVDEYDYIDKEPKEIIEYSYFVTEDKKYYRSFEIYKKGYEENYQYISRGVDKDFKSYEDMEEDMRNPDKAATVDYL